MAWCKTWTSTNELNLVFCKLTVVENVWFLNLGEIKNSANRISSPSGRNISSLMKYKLLRFPLCSSHYNTEMTWVISQLANSISSRCSTQKRKNQPGRCCRHWSEQTLLKSWSGKFSLRSHSLVAVLRTGKLCFEQALDAYRTQLSGSKHRH